MYVHMYRAYKCAYKIVATNDVDEDQLLAL